MKPKPGINLILYHLNAFFSISAFLHKKGPQYFSCGPLDKRNEREERAQLVCKYCYANVSKNLVEKTGWLRAAARFFASAPCVPHTKLQAQFVA